MDDERNDDIDGGQPDRLEMLRRAAVLAASVWIACQAFTAVWFAWDPSDGSGPFGFQNDAFAWISAAGTVANAVFIGAVGIYVISWLQLRRRAGD